MADQALGRTLPRPELVVLDRDGVINRESERLVLAVDDWRPIDGSLEAIARLSTAGLRLAIATNQSAVGRGWLATDTLDSIHRRMLDEISAAGGRIERVAVCPHAPGDGCSCRKPAPGLLLELGRTLDVAPGRMLFVGDAVRDLEAAAAAGAVGVLVRTGKGAAHVAAGEVDADVPLFDDLAAVAAALLADR
ncbi:MAG: D-glycero-beta-D-manno-heptose 1,7-bisphosphate 7-phosphatase [Acidobacteriota bacterium]